MTDLDWYEARARKLIADAKAAGPAWIYAASDKTRMIAALLKLLDDARRATKATALLVLVALSTPAYSQQTPRMSYQESSAIKRSMLPPGGQMRDYELDHCTPLCLGGSNDRSNLQLQLWDEAILKDKDEVAMCSAVRTGRMTREAAIAQMTKWWPCGG